LRLEKAEIEANLNRPQKMPSNPEKAIEIAIQLASKLNTVWTLSDYANKQKLQNLILPEDVLYNRKNDECRTLRTNSTFL
jgi:site-specific DNA recombinase